MCVCVYVCVLVYSLTRSRASELTMCYTQLKIAHRIYIDPVFAYQKISIKLNWNLRNLIKNLL